MSEPNSRPWTRAFVIVTRVCAACGLGLIVALAWTVRRLASPTAKAAGAVEGWALDHLDTIRSELADQ